MNIAELLKSIPHNARYLDRYIAFVISRQQRALLTEEFTENHHICPKANDMFPQYKSLRKHMWNSLRLTPREHFIAHWLLWKAYGRSQTYAFAHMCNRRGQKTSRIYANIRKDVVRLLQLRSVSEQTKQKMRKPKPIGFGQKISNALKGKPKSPSHIEAQRLAQKGLTKHTAEYRSNLSAKMSASGNPMHDQKHSEITKSKMKQKAKGRGAGLRWYNDGKVAFRCHPDRALVEWIPGRKIY